MTSKLKIEKLQLYVNQMKASNPGNLKIALEYMVYLLVMTSYYLLMTSKLKIATNRLYV